MASRDDREERREYVGARNRAENHRSGFDRTTLKLPADVQMFSLKEEGTITIDIIPYIVGQGNPEAAPGKVYFERTFFTHRDIGPNASSYVCPAKTAGKRCPICEFKAKALKDADADPKEIKALEWKERQLWNVIDHDNPDRGVQVWEVSFHLFGKLLDKKIRRRPDQYEMFYHHAEGLTLVCGVGERSLGKGSKPFLEIDDIEFQKREKPYKASIMDKATCLDDILDVLPYDKLKAIFLQLDDNDPEDVDAEPAPKRKPAPVDDDDDAPPPKAKAKPAPVDDDEEPAPRRRPAPVDDDEPPPKRKPAPVAADDDDVVTTAPKRKPAPVDDDDDVVTTAPKRKPAPVAADDDDVPPPKRKPAPVDDDDDVPPPRAKAKPAPDDEPAPKRKPPVATTEDWDDWDDAPPPKAKAKPAPVADDEEPAPRKRRPVDED